MTIVVLTLRIDLHTKTEHASWPRLEVFAVSVETKAFGWRESFGSREQVDAFIRGVKAGAAAFGEFNVRVEERTVLEEG